MKLLKTPLLALLLFISCKEIENKPDVRSNQKVEKQEEDNKWLANNNIAHKKQSFLSKDVISFNIDLSFGGKQRLKGTVYSLPNSRKALIINQAGDSIYVIDDKVYHNIKEPKNNKIRFDAYTWTYFFLLPYKINDNGVILNDYKTDSLNKETYNTQKLTFKANTGDAPDDWYILYSNKENNLLEVASYIVTANKSQDDAEKDPHAIKYEDYKPIQGIPFAHKWTFWTWREKEGLTNQLGEAFISDVSFVNKAEYLFNAPKNFTVIE